MGKILELEDTQLQQIAAAMVMQHYPDDVNDIIASLDNIVISLINIMTEHKIPYDGIEIQEAVMASIVMGLNMRRELRYPREKNSDA